MDKHWKKKKCCENANQNNKVGGWTGVRGVQLRHLKKIPHGFGLLKYFTLSFFFFLKKIWKHLKNMQIVWKSCMANSDSLQASFRCLSRIIKKPLPTRLHRVEEVFPILSYLTLDGSPEVCAAVTNKVLLSGREGTVEFPLVGEQPSFSFSRYSAWTGLWHWRTFMASSTLNHSLFLPEKHQMK